MLTVARQGSCCTCVVFNWSRQGSCRLVATLVHSGAAQRGWLPSAVGEWEWFWSLRAFLGHNARGAGNKYCLDSSSVAVPAREIQGLLKLSHGIISSTQYVGCAAYGAYAMPLVTDTWCQLIATAHLQLHYSHRPDSRARPARRPSACAPACLSLPSTAPAGRNAARRSPPGIETL